MFETQLNVYTAAVHIWKRERKKKKTRMFYLIKGKTVMVPALPSSSYYPISCGTELGWGQLCANPARLGSKVATHTTHPFPSATKSGTQNTIQVVPRCPLLNNYSVYSQAINYINTRSLVTADRSKRSVKGELCRQRKTWPLRVTTVDIFNRRTGCQQ